MKKDIFDYLRERVEPEIEELETNMGVPAFEPAELNPLSPLNMFEMPESFNVFD